MLLTGLTVVYTADRLLSTIIYNGRTAGHVPVAEGRMAAHLMVAGDTLHMVVDMSIIKNRKGKCFNSVSLFFLNFRFDNS